MLKPYLMAVILIAAVTAILYAATRRPSAGDTPAPSLSASAIAGASPSVETTVMPTQVAAPTPSQQAAASPSPSHAYQFVQPIVGLLERSTKIRFGTYVTPNNSPVQPERFQGYHTGVDVEYADVEGDVPVYAAADGIVKQAGFVSGYGGLLVIQHPNLGLYTLYGHLRVTSLPAVGSTVKQSAQVGLLGTGYSKETDGERRHLHFAVIKSSAIDVRGYVQSTAELQRGWQDPLSLY